MNRIEREASSWNSLRLEHLCESSARWITLDPSQRILDIIPSAASKPWAALRLAAPWEISMTNTTIVTTTEALSRAADAILARYTSTHGNLTKNGLLDALAKEIGGARQNWGGIKSQEHFIGIGAPRPPQPGPKVDEQANVGYLKPRWRNVPYGPPGSAVVTTIAGAEITYRELYNAKVAWEVINEERAWSDEVRECLYDMIRPWMNSERNENYANSTLTQLLQHITMGHSACPGRHARVILFAWGSIRFQDRGVDDYEPAVGEVVTFLEQLDRLGWSGHIFDRFRWSYGSWNSPQEAWWRENKDEAIAWLVKACKAAHETLRRDTTRRDLEDLHGDWIKIPLRPLQQSATSDLS